MYGVQQEVIQVERDLSLLREPIPKDMPIASVAQAGFLLEVDGD